MRKYKNIFYLIPFILVVFDSLLSLFERQGVLAYLQGGFLITMVAIGYLLYYKKSRINHIIILIAFYWLILCFSASDVFFSFYNYVKIIISLLMLPIAYSVFETKEDYNSILRSIKYILIYFPIFSLLSNIFDIGINQYAGTLKTEVFSVGLYDAQLYTPAIVIPLLLFFYNIGIVRKGEKKVFWILIVINTILLVLSVRRTASLIILLGIFSFYFFQGKMSNFVKILFFFGLFALVSYPIYKDALFERLALRETNMSRSIEDEQRYLETVYIIEDFRKSDDLMFWLFGTDIFDNAGKYANGIFGKRIIHVDFNSILFGSGLIGLLLYLLIFFFILNETYKYNRDGLKLYSTTLKVLVILSFFISLSGQMYEASFRSVQFIMMGTLLASLHQEDYR